MGRRRRALTARDVRLGNENRVLCYCTHAFCDKKNDRILHLKPVYQLRVAQLIAHLSRPLVGFCGGENTAVLKHNQVGNEGVFVPQTPVSECFAATI